MSACSDQSVREILESLRILTTPVKRSINKPSASASEEFDNLLLGNLHLLHQKLNSTSVSDLPCFSALLNQTSELVTEQVGIRWNFTSVCLYLLLLLQRHLTVLNREFQEKITQDPPTKTTPHQEPPLSPDVLSIEQEKSVLTALQFVVSLGICPNLDKGVGIPLERRSGFGSLVGEKSEDLLREVRYARLAVCGRVLMTYLDIPTLGALVLSRHLSDLMAVLLQVNHGSGTAGKTNSSFGGRTVPISDPSRHDDASKTFSETSSRVKDIPQTSDCESEPSRHSRTLSDHASRTFSDCTEEAPQTSDASRVLTNDDSRLNPKDEHPLKEGEGTTEDAIRSLTSETECNFSHLIDELNIKDNHQTFAEAAVQQIMSKVRPSLLVRDLILLQGGPKPKTAAKMKGVPLPVSPTWLRHVCGTLMTDILMTKRGLLHVLQGMLPPATGTKGIGDWLKCQAVAMVISHCPVTVTSVEEYYKHICSQILGLLHHRDAKITRHYLRVIAPLMKEMTNQHAELVQRHLVATLLNPLHLCTQDCEASPDKIVATEQEIALCIEDLTKVYVHTTETQDCLWPELSRYIPVLFHLYCCTKAGVSHLRKPCEDILVTCLKRADTEISVDFLWLLATGTPGVNVRNVAQPLDNLVFRSGDSGGLSAIAMETTDSETDIRLDVRVDSLVELVKHLQENGVAGEFLIKLLQELTEMISCEANTDVTTSQTSLGQQKELLVLEEQDTQEVELFSRKLIVLNLLASICEELGPSCIKKTHHILAFVKATLERAVKVCKATTDEMTGFFESETITMGMGLLTAVMGGAVEVDTTDQDTMQELLPLLDEIRHEHTSDEVREMADDIRIAIATRGAVWSELLKKKKPKAKKPMAQEKLTQPESKSQKPLIEVLSETSADENVLDKTVSPSLLPSSKSSSPPENTAAVVHSQNIKARDERLDDKDHKMSELEQAFQELCDPEIPVRGHGLLRLTHLLEVKDTSALEKAETLVKIFEENLQHSDSYLYLASVNGLAALADKCPDIVVPRLSREFADFDSGPRKKSAEIRVKLGESLVKTARYLGDMIPKYRDVLLAAILSGTRSDDAMVRASSLSNLAEVCHLLRFSLGSVMHEVVLCCSSVMKTDPDPEARKAATMTITQILQGLGSDSLKVLDEVMRDLHRLLKHVHTSDPDDMVRTHACLALNELDAITREALFPKQKLQKKITILHPD